MMMPARRVRLLIGPVLITVALTACPDAERADRTAVPADTPHAAPPHTEPAAIPPHTAPHPPPSELPDTLPRDTPVLPGAR